VSPKPMGGEIKIIARREKDKIIIKVWDDGPGFTPEMIPSGHGLGNLQSRLSVLFGKSANLTVDSRNGGTTVNVSIPLNGHQANK